MTSLRGVAPPRHRSVVDKADLEMSFLFSFLPVICAVFFKGVKPSLSQNWVKLASLKLSSTTDQLISLCTSGTFCESLHMPLCTQSFLPGRNTFLSLLTSTPVPNTPYLRFSGPSFSVHECEGSSPGSTTTKQAMDVK